MRSLLSIKTHFGFADVDYHQSTQYQSAGYGERPELAVLRKRVKRRYAFATFNQLDVDTLAIRLTQASLCWDVIVRYVSRCDGYIVKTVSTDRERPISNKDAWQYCISYADDTESVNLTQNINRVMKLIYETRSVTPELVLDTFLSATQNSFIKGLVHAQDKLNALKHTAFNKFDLGERDGALLEYGLAGIEGRAVRADIQHSVEEMVREYIKKKVELGESVTASEGLQVLSLFKLRGENRVYYHYEDTDAGDMVRNNHVDDVNELPQEVLSKLAVLQVTGIGETGLSTYQGLRHGRCRILDGIGGVRELDRGEFVEDVMCVYVTPETMVEVQALAEA